jgi:nucleotide-binding universal stress UspA family protein
MMVAISLRRPCWLIKGDFAMSKQCVLVPNDGSDFCRQIYPHLLKFFRPEDCSLVLLRVGQPPVGLVGLPPRAAGIDAGITAYDTHKDAEYAAHPIYASQERESAVAAVRSELQADAQMLRDAGYEVSVEVRFGDRGDEIINFIETQPIDLIAMTTHWRRGIQKLIFGSVAQHVAGRVAIPILMVKPEE